MPRKQRRWCNNRPRKGQRSCCEPNSPQVRRTRQPITWLYTSNSHLIHDYLFVLRKCLTLLSTVDWIFVDHLKGATWTLTSTAISYRYFNINMLLLPQDRRKIQDLDRQIAATQTKVLEQRQKMGGPNASRDNYEMITKQIRTLENRLDKVTYLIKPLWSIPLKCCINLRQYIGKKCPPFLFLRVQWTVLPLIKRVWQ